MRCRYEERWNEWWDADIQKSRLKYISKTGSAPDKEAIALVTDELQKMDFRAKRLLSTAGSDLRELEDLEAHFWRLKRFWAEIVNHGWCIIPERMRFCGTFGHYLISRGVGESAWLEDGEWHIKENIEFEKWSTDWNECVFTLIPPKAAKVYYWKMLQPMTPVWRLKRLVHAVQEIMNLHELELIVATTATVEEDIVCGGNPRRFEELGDRNRLARTYQNLGAIFDDQGMGFIVLSDPALSKDLDLPNPKETCSKRLNFWSDVILPADS